MCVQAFQIRCYSFFSVSDCLIPRFSLGDATRQRRHVSHENAVLVQGSGFGVDFLVLLLSFYYFLAQLNPHYDFVPPGGARLGFEDWAAYNFHVEFLAAPYYRDEPEILVMEGFESDAITSMGIEYMEEARRAGEPFFLVLAPHPPHPPFDRLPEGYLEKVPDDLYWSDNVPPDARGGTNYRDARG